MKKLRIFILTIKLKRVKSKINPSYCSPAYIGACHIFNIGEICNLNCKIQFDLKMKAKTIQDRINKLCPRIERSPYEDIYFAILILAIGLALASFMIYASNTLSF